MEHVQPKSLHPEKACDWDNLLLACVNCNSTKNKTDVNDSNLRDFLWPDINNTFLALKYTEEGIVSVNKSLSKSIQEKALRLIHLVGLDKFPDNSSDMSDRRWQNRREEWNKAVHVKNNLAENDTPEQRDTIATMANSYFSIWMTVFSDDTDVKRRFVEKFIGTAKDCFDKDFNPIPKEGGCI